MSDSRYRIIREFCVNVKERLNSSDCQLALSVRNSLESLRYSGKAIVIQ